MASSDSSSSDVDNDDRVLLSAAELVRRKRATRGNNKVVSRKNELNTTQQTIIDDSFDVDIPTSYEEDDLDDAIRKLEAKLATKEADDSSSCTSGNYEIHTSSQQENNNENDTDNEGTTTSNSANNNNGILMLSSSLQHERIESLPDKYLPKTKKRILKGIDTAVVLKSDRKKRKRAVSSSDEHDGEGSAEIRAQVQEILGNYKPRSIERLPFYCRCCALQCDSEESFFSHRATSFHRTAVEMERKASYCKLCRKQLTSPAQLKEHIQSKPHKQRLEMLKSKHQHQSKPRNKHFA